MGISTCCSSPGGSAPGSLLTGKQYALVSYLPDPLARFLDELRLDLVPDCTPRAHVTILPPRPLRGEPKQAMKEIRQLGKRFHPFTLQLGDIELFAASNVVYIDIEGERNKLFEMYRTMNSGVLSYQEAYEYCPHITLAQRLAPDAAQKAFETARCEWKAFTFSRCFRVERLHFVESDEGKCWRDLSETVLKAPPAYAEATRRVPAAPLYRV
jgi:2'-5' RNA ligase